MGRYAREPDNATKSCKSRGSNLRVHFKVRTKQFYVYNTIIVMLNFISMYIIQLYFVFVEHTRDSTGNQTYATSSCPEIP